MARRALLKAALMLGGFLALGSGAARAQGNLVMYCSVNEQWCRALATAFQQQTGIRVDMTRQSSGEMYARLRAERNNPRGDVWFGGTGDPHLQAAAEELTEPYQSPTLPQLQDWARRQAERSNNRTVGVYMGALGYGYNETELRRRNLTAPRCWSDLLRPEFRGEVQMADPNASGTAYTMLATMVQLMGEEPAFDYLKRLHRNIDQYPSIGAAPAQATARGETLIGVVFQHDAIDAQRANPNVRVVSPCEGTGYEIGSMSIVRGARNPEQARRFYEWVLTPAAQALGATNGSLQVPSNPATPMPPGAPDLSQIRLIDYDFARYGSTAERTRLLARWTREVKNAR
ncbi:ABC transporter substrate-binding protein [Muricoccus radiodurans]|uniref:ABC transporter substrate-binding protein n=1 Tax=Muricoccus radiodurans TaxID=2231721 RepID=UPI003CEE3898